MNNHHASLGNYLFNLLLCIGLIAACATMLWVDFTAFKNSILRLPETSALSIINVCNYAIGYAASITFATAVMPTLGNLVARPDNSVLDSLPNTDLHPLPGWLRSVGGIALTLGAVRGCLLGYMFVRPVVRGTLSLELIDLPSLVASLGSLLCIPLVLRTQGKVRLRPSAVANA